MVSRRQYRVTFAVVIAVCAAVLLHGYATAPVNAAMNEYRDQGNVPFADREPVAPQSDGVTVVSGQGFDGDTSSLVAFAPDGRVLYYNDTYTGYFDVDPADGGTTVEYVAEKPLSGPRAGSCKGECTLSVVERVNLTTGEVTRLYSRVIPQDKGANWHDVDRINDTHLVIAGIYEDQVYVVNTTSGLTTWEWDAQTAFPIDEGGPYPVDWTHLNDVEVLADGRIMVSLRNQDQVVFLEPGSGLNETWTLGAEGDYEVMYEQHNPDYIPEDRGGPAVVVADSLNDRIVEYQRVDGGERTEGSRSSSDEGNETDGVLRSAATQGSAGLRPAGEWTRTWTWTDSEMVWPRDADRLPNGHTLIADSNGRRVVEVDADGDVVWSVDFYSSYDVERLGTGDESAGGPSATRAGLQSRRGEGSEPSAVAATLNTVLSPKTVSGIWFVLPVWMEFGHLVAVAGIGLTAIVWVLAELRDCAIGAELQWPIRFSR